MKLITSKKVRVFLKKRRSLRIIAIFLSLLVLPLMILLVLQSQDLRQHAAVQTAAIVRSPLDIELTAAGIDSTGKVNEDRSKDLALLSPTLYQKLLTQGLVTRVTVTNTPKITLVRKPVIVPVRRLFGRMSMSPQTLRAAAASTTPITKCGDISAAGDYVLTQDISGSNGCLTLHGTSNITLDCQSHTVTSTDNVALSLVNVQNYSIKNCSFHAQYPQNNDVGSLALIQDSSHGVFQGNTFMNGLVNLSNSNYLQVVNNVFNASYQQQSGSNNQITSNSFTAEARIGYAGNIILGFGSRNTVQNNTINGSWNGVVAPLAYEIGADDGIVLQGESQDTIAGNSITNVWDCGIETLGFIQNTQIKANRINAGGCGIGGWYWNSWLNNTVQDNRVESAAYLFMLFRIFALSPDETTVYFKNNSFTNNTFVSRKSSSSFGWTNSNSSNIDFGHPPSGIPASALQLGNNTFQDNNMNITFSAPFITPGSMAVDLGGNICLTGFPAGGMDQPLRCINLVTPGTPFAPPTIAPRSGGGGVTTFPTTPIPLPTSRAADGPTSTAGPIAPPHGR